MTASTLGSYSRDLLRVLSWGVLLGVGGMLLFPGVAHSQSLLSGGGLGIPAEPLDARTRAVGGAGVGLSGWMILPTDPAAAAGLNLPSVGATFQPSVSSIDGEAGEAGHTRFPVAGVSYPYRGSTFTLLMGSFLDQEWQARSLVTLDVGGEEVDAQDTFRSDGGVGQVRLGWARRISESLAVGVSAGTLTGSLERTFIRELDPEQVGSGVEPFRSAARWGASGLVASAGVAWDPTDLLRVGGSLTWSDGLELRPVAGSRGETRDYSIPMEYRLGATMTLAPQLALVLGATYADWTATGEDLQEGRTRGSTWSYGGGVEWLGATLLNRPMPVRLGYRSQDLPFHFQESPASEQAFTGGMGINLADSDEMPVARVELGVQRGSREAGPLSENFWRATLSLRLAGG